MFTDLLALKEWKTYAIKRPSGEAYTNNYVGTYAARGEYFRTQEGPIHWYQTCKRNNGKINIYETQVKAPLLHNLYA